MIEDTLLAAIREDPDNPSTWSVYADWLQSRGDPDGELIALQLERDRCTDPLRRDELVARIRQMPAPDGGIDAAVRVDISTLPALVSEAQRKIFRVLSLYIRDIEAEQVSSLVAALPSMPLRAMYLGRLEAVHLRRILAASGRLRYLAIYDASQIHAEIVAETEPWLMSFYTGNVSPIGDAGVAALATIPALRSLETPDASIGPAGVTALLDRLPIEKLVLTGNPIGDEGVARICAATSLRELAIDATGFTSQSAVALARAPGLASLRQLRLGSNDGRSNLTPNDLQTLIESPHLSRELVLEIDGHALGLTSEYRERDYAPEFDGWYWTSEPTGPITERFRVEVRGLPG